ncbi:hypothetical protein, partial [Escherichia coli]|uniref:hypothetical protein n=1 Tax=Escherichia coli TaxID=562 RepID=UPI001BC8A2FE
ADRNRSHWSTSKTPSYTKSVSWQHHPIINRYKNCTVVNMKFRSQTIPMMIVAECNYYCLSALYIVCNKPGLKILINGYRKSL